MSIELVDVGVDSVIWLFTARCPLNCVHCYAKMYLLEPELGIRDAKRIVDEFAKVGVNHLHITGGDPVATRFRDLLELARYSRSLGIEVSVFTSCIAKPTGVEELARYVDTLFTSVDGYDATTFESVRGPNTWKKFVENYRGFRRLFSEVHVNIAVTKLNHGYVDKVLEFAIHVLEPDSVSVIPAMNCGRARETRSYVSREEFLKALKLLGDAARRLGVEVACWCTPFAHLIDNHLLSSSCRGRSIVDLSPSGRILVCDVMGISVSNVAELGFRKAFEEYAKSEIVRKALSIPRACRGCRYLGMCGGGCFARSYLEFGDVDVGDPLCPFSTPSSI